MPMADACGKRSWAAAALVVALGGCSANDGNAIRVPCVTNDECPFGHYCGPGNVCTFNCRTEADCQGGWCNARGMCEARFDAFPTVRDASVPRIDAAAIDAPASQPADASVIDGPFTPDQTVIVDGAPADLSETQKYCAAIIGKPCTQNGGECQPYGTCILYDHRGVCSCPCTADCSTTPENEDTCPDLSRNRCARINGFWQYCVQLCEPRLGVSECQGHLACHPHSGEIFNISILAACLRPRSESNADCPVTTTRACTTADPQSCPAGQTCVSVGMGATAGHCTVPGRCDPISGLCDAHTMGKASARVGDPCVADTDCAGNMTCKREIDTALYKKGAGEPCTGNSECCSGTCTHEGCSSGPCMAHYRNGYCTIEGCAHGDSLAIRACPAGSRCNHLYTPSMCQKSCRMAVADDCRGQANDRYGDYECRSYANLFFNIDGSPFTSGPVCDFGLFANCERFPSCSALGETGNPTYMKCRGLDGTLKANWSPAAFCFDNTASGPLP
jgi:hypothetical protein